MGLRRSPRSECYSGTIHRSKVLRKRPDLLVQLTKVLNAILIQRMFVVVVVISAVPCGEGVMSLGYELKTKPRNYT